MGVKSLFLLPALTAGFGLTPAGRLTAQTITVLHTFSQAPNWPLTNWDGAQPYHTGLALSGSTLYGTTYYGGTNASGTLFSVNTDGNGFAVLHTFTGSQAPDYTNLDGEYQQGGLAISGSALYGTALNGGTFSGGYGTVFSLSTNGAGFNTLHGFNGDSDGGNPLGPLVLSSNKLYGAAESGGAGGQGCVFSVDTDGTDFKVLHSLTNTDGELPYAGLLLLGNCLYGTADYGGAYGNGTVFSVNTDGTDFTVLHAFSRTSSPSFTNYDGTYPEGGLVLGGNTLYGTTTFGGAYDKGTLFSININGTGFRVIHTFTGSPDGWYPLALLSSGEALYGTAEAGGVADSGTIFSINTDGSKFTVLHTFSDYHNLSFTNIEGADPEGALVLSGSTLYGTTEYGGAYGNGTVFSLALPGPQLTISSSGANVILRWPTNSAGFTLQYTMSLISPAVWTNVSPGSVVVNGQNAVTNPVSDTQKYYRLSK